MIASDTMDIVIASGCEIMSKYPIGSDMGGTLPDGRPQGDPYGQYYIDRVKGKFYNQAQASAGDRREVGRHQGDVRRVRRGQPQKAHQATVKRLLQERDHAHSRGSTRKGTRSSMEQDETIRPDTNLEKLATLKPVLGTDWITAGISSPVTDGASAVVLMSGDKVKELKLTPLARIVANAVVGLGSGAHADRPARGHAQGAREGGHEDGRHRHLRGQRGLCADPPRLGQGTERPDGQAERERRRHGARPSGRQLRMPAHRHGDQRTARSNAKHALVTLCTGGAMAPATIFERA